MGRRELLRREFEVAAAVPTAWEGLVQVERWPEWAPHITAVTLLPPGPLTEASAGALRLRGGLRSTFRMSHWDPPRAWTWVGPVMGMAVHYDHRLEPSETGGTRIAFVVEGEGWPLPLIGRVFTRVYERNLDRAIPRLIRWTEDRAVE